MMDIFEKTVLLYNTGAIDFYRGKLEDGGKKMESAIAIFRAVESFGFATILQEHYDLMVKNFKKN